MVLINKAINEVTVKLVYYGPGLCGKTTNLEQIYKNPKLENKGKMISMATETDRTLFFDFMPMELGTIGGQKIRVQIYTVPGQVFYDATRKLVLRGADGVVFVADSQASMRESNLESLENLKTNLRLNRLDPDKVALVFQYNKRDLPGLSSVEEMNQYLNPEGHPAVEAAAIQGTGVTQTLRAAVARILENLKGNVDVTLYDAPPLHRPVMGAGSGATAASAGAPKVSIAALTAEKSAIRPPTRSGATPVPAPAAATPAAPPNFELVSDPARPFLSAPQFIAPEHAFPIDLTPLESNAFEAVDDSDESVEEEFSDRAPVEETAFHIPSLEPRSELPSFQLEPPPIESEPLGNEQEDVFEAEPLPFAAAPGAAAEDFDHEGLIHAADLLVRQLEAALEIARRHRDELQSRFGEH